MTDIEILTAARDLISNPARWTQNYFAKDEGGLDCSSIGTEAVCWCALGAIEKVSKISPLNQRVATYLQRASSHLYGMTVASVNDNLGHEAILAVYDRAIELAQG